MTTSVEMAQLFGSYATAFSHGNIDEICGLFAEPCGISGSGFLLAMSNREEARSGIEQLLAKYAGLGMSRVRITKLIPNLYASDHAVTDIEWTMLRADGSEIIRFDNTYMVKKIASDWKIVFVVAHNEGQRLRQLERSANPP